MGGPLANASAFSGGNQYTILDALNATLSNVTGSAVQRPAGYQPPGMQPGTGGGAGKSIDGAGNSTLGFSDLYGPQSGGIPGLSGGEPTGQNRPGVPLRQSIGAWPRFG